METLQKDSRTLIALGSNQYSPFGGPQATLIRAMQELACESLHLRAVSRFFNTPAFPAGSGPDFVNAAVLVTTALSPDAILAALHRIEVAANRVRDRRWGARTLDLDLIAVDDTICPDAVELGRWIGLSPEDQARIAPQQLILPHPRLQDRAFVLVPLADIAPAWRHPLTGASVAEMLAALPAHDRAEVRPI